jgi:hypothetical protein
MTTLAEETTMNKAVYAIAFTLVAGTTAALASPGDDGCVGNCPNSGGSGGGPNTNQQQQGQVSINENTSQSTATAGANSTSVSGSNSSSTSYSGGNSLGQSVGVSVRGPNVSTEATGGQSSATGGNATSGDSSSGANSEINITGDSYDYAASSAAAVFANECQSGLSGQVEKGGFAVINPDQFCQHVKAARIALQAYEWELENGTVTCHEVEYGYVTPEGQDHVVETLQEVCYSEKADEYLAEYRHHTDAAISLVSATEEVGLVDSFFGYLIRPVAVVAAIILLL